MIFIYIFYADVFCIQSYLMKLLCMIVLSRIHGLSVRNHIFPIFISSIIFAFFESLVLVKKAPFFIYILLNMCFIPIATTISFPLRDKARWIRFQIEGLIVVMAMNGSAMALKNLTGGRIPFIPILFIAFGLVELILRFVKKSRKIVGYEIFVTIENKGKKEKVISYWDSGNQLYYMNNEPVSFLGSSLIRKLGLEQVDHIYYETIGEKPGVAPLYCVDKLIGKDFVKERCYVADGGKMLEKSSYQMILHRDYMKEERK